ncbi:MAG: DUF1573 domain-containing protein [Bernardetiaceae bacterium]
MKKFLFFIGAFIIGLTAALAQEGSELSFDEVNYEFGTVKQGEQVDHNFKFTNASPNPIVITNVRTTCGCTVPQWPREPIAAGETANINAIFNTRGKQGYQRKVVTISYTVKGKDGQEDQMKTTNVALVGTVAMPDQSND